MKKLFFVIVFSIIFAINHPIYLSSQELTQVVRGRVIDANNQHPVIGATVLIADTKLGSFTQQDGTFKIKNVPVGRQKLVVRSVSYESRVIDIIVGSGKEIVKTIELIPSIVETGEVKVVADRGGFASINETAIVSSTLFDMDDVERFAGARNDPARMAQNYAGVVGTDDSRNDIIIRGGSPTELLWRVDGLDIPNPNHFATQGATGGPVNAINSLLLANSDFITGAFPAEYTDKMSGVFDLKTRKGNDEKYEFTGQFGFNGFEFGAEGPTPFERSSFIANYRYSFLDLIDKMGFDLGFAGIPRYQDGTLKLDFQIGQADYISLTSIFGISEINIKESEEDDVYTGDFDILNGSDLFTLGINWKHLFSKKVFSTMTTGYVYSNYLTDMDSITTDPENNVLSADRWFVQNSAESYITMKYNLNYLPEKSHSLAIGAESRILKFNLSRKRIADYYDGGELWINKADGNGLHFLSFFNWNWRPDADLTVNLGLSSQYHSISKKYTAEPRATLSYRLSEKHSCEFGFGVHRQSLPLSVLYSNQNNEDLDFMQSVHYIAGYSWQPFGELMLKAEIYYKNLSKIPVEAQERSAWSFLNTGADYGAVTYDDRELKSTGNGKAYGFDFSATKHFTDGYYITGTASFIRQKYEGSDGIERNGAFDNKFVFNLLAGYEWKLSETHSLDFSGKYIIAGGVPYTPVDPEKSKEASRTEHLEDEAFSLRYDDYSKFDIKVEFRHNYPGFAIISFISAENIFNQNNPLMYLYDVKNDNIKRVNQLGTFIVGGFRIEF